MRAATGAGVACLLAGAIDLVAINGVLGPRAIGTATATVTTVAAAVPTSAASPGAAPSPAPAPPAPAPAARAVAVLEEVAPIPPAASSVPIEAGVTATIFFATDRATLQRVAATRLDELAHHVVVRPTLTVHLTGRADAAGSDRHNRGLALRRVQRVADHLVRRGVERARIRVSAVGERDAARTVRSRDRRVDVELEVGR